MLKFTKQQIVTVSKALAQSYKTTFRRSIGSKLQTQRLQSTDAKLRKHLLRNFRRLLSFLRCLGTFAGEFLTFALHLTAQLISSNRLHSLFRNQTVQPAEQINWNNRPSNSTSRASFTLAPAPCDASSQRRRACQRCQQCRKLSKSPSREHQS